MPFSSRPRLLVTLLLSLLLAACGGGGDADRNAEITAEAAARNNSAIASATIDWINTRRQQMGLPVLARNSLLDAAAQGHSNYQRENDVITHSQQPGNPGYTGATLLDRLNAAGYRFTRPNWATGEVLVATGNPEGMSIAEALLVAVYHRFIVLEPRFTEVGAGAASAPDSYTYATVDFTADGLGPALPAGTIAVYPFPGQQQVPTVFFSDNETPDPVPDSNAVGYPVSVQSGIVTSLTVNSFTIQPRGGMPLAVKLLSHALDTETPEGAAAIVPLEPLQPNTVYDVQFTGSTSGQVASRGWSFTTR